MIEQSTTDQDLHVLNRDRRCRDVDLVLLIGLCGLMGLLIFLTPSSPVRFAAGLLCIFYAPGYSLLAALYPSEGRLGRGQRLAASVGMSVVVTGLLLLAATFTVGTSLRSSFAVLAAWIVAMVSIAWYRRRLVPASDRFPARLGFQLRARREDSPGWLSHARLVAILVLVFAAGRLLWISGQTDPQYTEFYLLGSDGRAGNYPERAMIGSPITVTVGIVNHGVSTTYDLFYRIDEGADSPLESIVLDDKERWESEITLYPLEVPGRQKATFTLQTREARELSQSLHIWLDARSPDNRERKDGMD